MTEEARPTTFQDAPLPLNITLSIGNVNFHLVPSPPPAIATAAAALTPSPSRLPRQHVHAVGGQPYPNQRRRHTRRNKARDQHQCHHISEEGSKCRDEHGESSAEQREYLPILSIRRAPLQELHQQQETPPELRPSSNLFSSLSMPQSINSKETGTFSPSRFSPSSPQSPLHNYILGRVRAMRDKIESSSMDCCYISNENRRKSAPIFSSNNRSFRKEGMRSSLGTPENNASNDNRKITYDSNSSSNIGGNVSSEYCVDLHSFTGTLRISSIPQSAQTTQPWCGGIKLPQSHPWQKTSNMNHIEHRKFNSPKKRPAEDLTNDNNQTNSLDESALGASLHSKRTKPSFTWIVSSDQGVEAGMRDETCGDNFVNTENRDDEDVEDQRITEKGNDHEFIVNNIKDKKKDDSGDIKALHSAGIEGGRKSVQFHCDLNASAASAKIESQEPSNGPSLESESNNTENEFHNNSKQRAFFPSPTKATFPGPPLTAISATAKAVSTSANSSMQYARETSKFVLKQVKQYGMAGKEIYSEIQHSFASPKSDRAPTSPSESSDAALEGGGSDDTELHRACAFGTLAHIRHLLLNDEQSINNLNTPNSKGILPIHIFTANEAIVTSNLLEAEEIALLMVHLMGPEKAIQSLHPPTSRDSSGWSPFVYVIGQWVHNLHKDANPHASILLNAVRGTVIKTNNEPPREIRSDGVVHAALPLSREQSQIVRSRKIAIPLFGSALNERALVSSTFVADRFKSLHVPPSVEIPDHVKWAVHILSRLINEHPDEARESILTNIASVPLFLKCVFLINDADEMTRLLNTSLVKNVIIDKRSINVWLIAMLIGKRDIKMRAVNFFKMLSRLTILDVASSSQSRDRYSDHEIERFVRLKRDAFTAIYAMPGEYFLHPCFFVVINLFFC